ncbi:hypothetical protein AKJ51_03590 [candidate division MSBL1 archaeon SCGC-AAA382A20]|uniref:Hydrogenase maturation factor HypA n=1 Tax=candidate division MSBL1 archaeon SCGC-AAA382A20 TaxID=1698280 RepID=A0A133VJB7_9EURY|nr:hypothetical protein AKJ51_03590 [candidate division MSBL1 archaeon SCGC-AAA382A20]
MHEWSLAEGVISTAISVAEDNDAENISAINIKIGELQQVEMDIFKLALKETAKGTMAEDSEINIKHENAVLECRSCEKKWNFEESREDLSEEEKESIHFLPDFAHTYIRCPNCNSPDFKIVEGRGVWIDSVELEK